LAEGVSRVFSEVTECCAAPENGGPVFPLAGVTVKLARIDSDAYTHIRLAPTFRLPQLRVRCKIPGQCEGRCECQGNILSFYMFHCTTDGYPGSNRGVTGR